MSELVGLLSAHEILHMDFHEADAIMGFLECAGRSKVAEITVATSLDRDVVLRTISELVSDGDVTETISSKGNTRYALSKSCIFSSVGRFDCTQKSRNLETNLETMETKKWGICTIAPLRCLQGLRRIASLFLTTIWHHAHTE